MHHPFDQLTFNKFAWRADIYSQLLKAEVELIVVGDNNIPPAQWQRQVYDKLVELTPRLRLPILRTVLAEVSSLTSIEALEQAITPIAIVISNLAEDDAEIGLLFECDWDPEHGLGVRLARWQIDEIGGQEICF